MNKQRIAIITDSGTDTDEDFRKEHDIRIMPLRKGVDKLFKTGFRNRLPSEHLCLDESAPKFCIRPMRRIAFVNLFP